MNRAFKKGDKVWWQPAFSRMRKTGTVIDVADSIVSVWYRQGGHMTRGMVHVSQLNHLEED